MEYEKFTSRQDTDGGEDFVARFRMQDPIDDDFEFEPVDIGLKPDEFEEEPMPQSAKEGGAGESIVQKLLMAEPTDAEFEPVHFELKVPEF